MSPSWGVWWVIPDIRAKLPDNLGGTPRQYIDVNTSSGLSKWYQPARGERDVEWRHREGVQGGRLGCRPVVLRYRGQPRLPAARHPHPYWVGFWQVLGDLRHGAQTGGPTVARVEKQSMAWGRGEVEEKPHQDRKAAWMATVSAVQSSAMQCR